MFTFPKTWKNVLKFWEIERGRKGQDVVAQTHDGVTQKLEQVVLSAAGSDNLVYSANNILLDLFIVDLKKITKSL